MVKAKGGFTGKTLRVNLTTGKITAEDTLAKYGDFLGGTGIGYKVLWDEVPIGTRAFDEANKIVFGVGPLAGTGAPCNSRTAITTIWPVCYPDTYVASGHMGGHFAAELKFAGWDSIIIEGKAPHPVWLCIEDDKVELKDARRLWGSGVYRTTAEINAEMGPEAQVAAIGPAGENMVPNAVVITGYSHSAGGVGGVMGSKNLKAIGVRGTGSVKIAADKKEWKKLIQYSLTLIGSNNQHVVPSTPQPWAEYHWPGSRWTASKGVFWGAANPPVETGTCDPHDMHSIGLRCHKGAKDFGNDFGEKHTVRMGGCHACPIRCHAQIEYAPVEEKYGYSKYAANTCMGWYSPRQVFHEFPGPDGDLKASEAMVLGSHIVNDLGVWDNYALMQKVFNYAATHGMLEKILPEDEYKSIPWELWENGDPEFLLDFYRRIAYKEGVLGKDLGDSTLKTMKKWGIPDDFYKKFKWKYWKMGHPYHHSVESSGQVGALINMQYNRDSQNHSFQNFIQNGLPIDVQKKLAAEVWGSPDAIDAPKNYTPMNKYKALAAKWASIKKELHDSLSLCNWMYPWVASPLKERGYRGDTSLEAKYFSLATGIEVTEEELDLYAERIFNLHRALTIMQMNTRDMRNEHDTAPDWLYEEGPEPFTPGSQRFPREDIEKAKDLFYEVCGWNKEGLPTRETLERLGLKDVADRLEKANLLG
ncbi:MAG: aldehyde ferredoxin oxidoreductase [Firmicutes bacterium]|nr:aldehyde ferredoxin oxidoreductase [Bacillota bacterium]